MLTTVLAWNLIGNKLSFQENWKLLSSRESHVTRWVKLASFKDSIYEGLFNSQKGYYVLNRYSSAKDSSIDFGVFEYRNGLLIAHEVNKGERLLDDITTNIIKFNNNNEIYCFHDDKIQR